MPVFQVAEGIKYFMHSQIAHTLDKKRELVSKKDRDFFFIVDGDEGTGKSFLALQCAKYLDPTFNLSRVCMTPYEFLHVVQNSSKAQAVVYDEAFTGFSSRRSMTEVSNMLNETVFECRKKNLFIFIVLPTIFFLDRTIVLHRGRVLFHTYFKNDKRGYFAVYTKPQLKTLILQGKPSLNYGVVKPKMRARFFGYFPLDVEGSKEKLEAYDQKKIDAIRNKGLRNEGKHEKKQIEQRNLLIWLWVKKGYPQSEFMRAFESVGAAMTQQMVSTIIREGVKYSALEFELLKPR